MSRPRAATAAGWAAALVAGVCGVAAGGAADDLRHTVEYLASPKLEGRLTGTRGAIKAAQYIEAQLRALGARPLPGQRGFDVAFGFTAGTHDAGSRLTLERAGDEHPRKWKGVKSIQALSFSDNGSVSGPVVFAGYGIVAKDVSSELDGSYTYELLSKATGKTAKQLGIDR